MAKKIVEVKDTKKSKGKIDIAKIKDFAEDNPELVEFAKDKIIDLLDGDDKKTSKSKTKKATKKTTKKSSSSDLSKVIDIAETLLK